MNSSTELVERFSLPGFGGGGGGGGSFDIGDYFGRFVKVFDIDPPDLQAGWDIIRDDDFGLQRLDDEFKALVDEWLDDVIADYHKWVDHAMPHSLWQDVDEFYARNSLGGYFVLSGALAWVSGGTTSQVMLPWPPSAGNVAAWHHNLNLWRAFWGAAGPMIGGWFSTITVSPILVTNMMLSTSYFLTLIAVHTIELMLKMTWATIKISFDMGREILGHVADEHNKVYKQLEDNVKEAFG